MTTFADRVIQFNTDLHIDISLPTGINVMNPFKENQLALQISSKFYKKYYNDNTQRILILGINPGRFGAGITGIPFTDTKRLEDYCELSFEGVHSHELSSVFIYDLINAYGGVKKFYNDYYFNSLSPLGFTIKKPTNKVINYNYYDDSILQQLLSPFIIWNINKQIELGCSTDHCYILGSGKNFNFFSKLNNKYNFFKKTIPLEHPRYIMQYKSKQKQFYIDKFLKHLIQDS